MFDYNIFDDVFDFNPSYKYDASDIKDIESRRKELDGLFVDRVLKLSDIKNPAKLYPPRTAPDLRNLHSAIVSGPSADHTKLSLLYYILLDCDAAHRRATYSDAFEEKSYLPKRYQIYMKGLWHMDRKEFEVFRSSPSESPWKLNDSQLALQYLTYPSLIPTFADEIMEVLVRHAWGDDMGLALAYYYSVTPSLKGTETLFLAIADVSVTEAFYFARGQAYSNRQHFLERLISFVLQTQPGDLAAARSAELINLPFDSTEEQWFEVYLSVGGGKQLAKAKETVIMRRIGTGHFAEARSMDQISMRPTGGLNWGMMQEALKDGLGPRASTDRAQ